MTGGNVKTLSTIKVNVYLMLVPQQFSGDTRHQKVQNSIQCKFKLLKYWSRIYSGLSDDPRCVLTCAKGHKRGCILYFWFL